MDQEQATSHEPQATPIFNAYRRGYDPEQVDRYVADQQRRLDEALKRASVAERRLGAAVGQLRELNKRVATLESQEKPLQAPALDTLGDRIQRILTEAWEGAYAIRQSAEQEVQELRTEAEEAAQEIISLAEERVRQAEEELKRQKEQQRHDLEQERAKAVAQISYLHEQKKLAMTDLLKLRDVITSTLAENLPPNLAEKYRQHVAKITDSKASFEESGNTATFDDDKAQDQTEASTHKAPESDTSFRFTPKIAARDDGGENTYEDRNPDVKIRAKSYEALSEQPKPVNFGNESLHDSDIDLALTMPVETIERKNITPHIDRKDISELVRRHREANKRLVEAVGLQEELFPADSSGMYEDRDMEDMPSYDAGENRLYDFSSDESEAGED